MRVCGSIICLAAGQKMGDSFEPQTGATLAAKTSKNTDNTGDTKQTFRLKTMVLARVLAEATVLLLLMLSPAILFILGKIGIVPVMLRAVLFVLAAMAGILLPAYGFITYQAQIDDKGLKTRSFFRQQGCEWSQIKSLTRRSNWNWLRYVVEFEGGELSFPAWLKSCEVLVENIRAHLPAGAQSRNPFRKFAQDTTAFIFQLIHAAAGVLFVTIFWVFYSSVAASTTTGMSDKALILGFCVVASVILAWRTFVVIRMPNSIELTPTELIVRSFWFVKNVPWDSVKKVGAPFPLLPDGFMIATGKGSFLVGEGMDSADELLSAIKAKIHQPEAEDKKSKK